MEATGVLSFLQQGVLTVKAPDIVIPNVFVPTPSPGGRLVVGGGGGGCPPDGCPTDDWDILYGYVNGQTVENIGTWYPDYSLGQNNYSNGGPPYIGPIYHFGPQPKPHQGCVQIALAAAGSAAISLVTSYRANPSFYQGLLGKLYGQFATLIAEFQAVELSGFALLTALGGLLAGSEFLAILAAILVGYSIYAGWQACVAGG